MLKKKQEPRPETSAEGALLGLQQKMLRIQQGIWHGRERVIVVFEGFDAAGKGGAIRRVTETLDPRGFRVHPIAAPDPKDQARHYLYRFWRHLPEPGTIAIFDRSWYGRVLVEKVEKLAPRGRIEAAFDEINAFEKLLTDDGIRLIKIFLAISKKEQLKRYQDRLNDPYKQWKLTAEDIRNRSRWSQYVKAVDEMFDRTSTAESGWHLVGADHKPSARVSVLEILTTELKPHEKWMNSRAARWRQLSLRDALRKAEKGT